MVTAERAAVSSEFGPAGEAGRFIFLDALRGFALFGVLLVNLRDLSLFGLLADNTRASLPTAPVDHWIDLIMTALIDGKAFTIFTVLFGIGFALQTQRAHRVGRDMSHYVRRLLVLLAIGLAHAYLFWWGDILRLYAVLGFLLLPMERLKPRTLFIVGVIIAVFVTPVLRPLMSILLPHTNSPDAARAAALTAFQSRSVPAMLRGNLAYDIWTRINAWGLPFYVLGRLIIGAALGKTAAFWQSQSRRRFGIGLLAVMLPLGIALTALVMLRDSGMLGLMSGSVLRIARSAGSLTLGFAYIALFIYLFESEYWRRWLSHLAPVGRMALTNYLAQTVIAMSIFYGIGCGVGPRYGLVAVLFSGVVIFAVQIVISDWWLRRFYFGPIEWIWRTLTYGKCQPMIRT
jgi:uncharacterized protein